MTTNTQQAFRNQICAEATNCLERYRRDKHAALKATISYNLTNPSGEYLTIHGDAPFYTVEFPVSLPVNIPEEVHNQWICDIVNELIGKERVGVGYAKGTIKIQWTQ